MKQTVFVTGANKGIGYGIAKHLGLSGWSIVLGARDEQRAEQAISELRALGIEVKCNGDGVRAEHGAC